MLNAKKVMAAMSARGLARTSLENIEDVLEALAKLAPPVIITSVTMHDITRENPLVLMPGQQVLMVPEQDPAEAQPEGYVDQDDANDLGLGDDACINLPPDDQAFDRNAERLTREMGLGGGTINPNATSVLDLFVDDLPPHAGRHSPLDTASEDD